MEEPEEIEFRAETLPEQVARVVSPWYQRPEIAAPVCWFIVGLLTAFFLYPTGGGITMSWWDVFAYLGIGAIYSLPLQCALWGAFAPQAPKWRLAAATIAVVLYGIALGFSDGSLVGLVVFSPLFVLFWCVLALVRALRGVFLHWQADPVRENNTGFGIAYLLGVTTVVALLASLIQYVLEFSDIDVGVPDTFQFVVMMLLIGLLLLQAILGWALVLGLQQRFLLGLVSIPIAVVLFSYAVTMGLMAVQPGPSFEFVWRQTSSIASGAVLHTLAFGIVLRYGGYRLNRSN